jgi:hypothetical protein
MATAHSGRSRPAVDGRDGRRLVICESAIGMECSELHRVGQPTRVEERVLEIIDRVADAIEANRTDLARRNSNEEVTFSRK